MKKFLFLGAMAAMLLGTASCSSDMEPAMGGETPVSFSVSLGDDIDSRTISDGTGANTLKFAVFENGTEITALAQNNVPVVDKKATVTTRLVKGHTYSFVFWAQNSKCTAYNTSDMSAITVNYAANCNDETRDAFYKMDSFTVTEPFEQEEELTRPFAQINFLADDAAGVVGVDAYKSKVTVTGVPTTLNTLDGSVSGTTNVTFDYATILPNEETLSGYEQYRYVAMNYILAGTDKEMKNKVVLTVNDGTQDVNTVTVDNCPVQRNYRTNIFGSLFTLQGKFNITIDPIYAGEYILPEKVWDGVTIKEPTVDDETVYITTPEEFAWLNGQNLTEKSVRIIELNADINMGKHPSNARALNSYSNPMRELRFKGNNHTIKGLAEPLFANTWAGAAKVYISDLTIDESNIVVDKDDEIEGGVGVGAFIGWPQASSVIDLTNCHVKNSTIEGGHWTGGLFGIAAGYSGEDGPVFEEVTVTNCSVENCTIQGKGSAGAFMGHGATDPWTKVTANGCTFKNNKVNGAGSNKTGVVLGTIGAAGKEKTVKGVSHTGGIYINDATVEGNTAISGGTTEVTRWAGRIGSKGGRLYKNGVDITQECPDASTNY